jgi:glutamate-ammonia-ligase adenylyltransferase
MPAEMESPDAVLTRFGVERARVTRAAEALRPFAAAAAERLLTLMGAAADPPMALAGWEGLFEVSAERARLALLSADEWAALFTLLGGSQVLTNTLQAAPNGWVALLRASLAAERRAARAHEEALRGDVEAPWEAFSERLRQLCHHEYLRIGFADLLGRYSVDDTVSELSALAAGLFAAAYRWARQALIEQFGRLHSPLRNPEAAEMGFVVLGMGKLGGGELNFSSDVDVMYLYEADCGESGGGSRGVAAARAYCTRLAELITRAIQEMTPAGFAFRVDLRLRPDGINGPIANPVDNALLYYGSYGQTWERTALIQARPIAGTLSLGEQFLTEVRPFVYRRNLDFTTVQDMKEMKARVEAQIGVKAGRGNVKLGRGGIREIEFLVQVLQLINGGRDERVRGGGSLATLAKLVASGYLPPDEGAALTEAYRFLRNVEHKIQIVHQRQTHTVPSTPREQEALARRLGYQGPAAVAQMWSDLDRHAERVRRNFERLFYEPAAETRRAGDPQTTSLLAALEDRDATLAALRHLGFADPEGSYENLLLLRDGPPFARARARRQQVLRDIAPALLGAIRRSADPDLALRNLATFISSIGAHTTFLALLRENPGTLRMLVELFGGSQFLANAFIRHPELLDSLVRADLVRVHRTTEALAAELSAGVVAAEDIEETFEVLRRFRNQEFLRIGINNLQGLLRPEEVSAELTQVAEVCLRTACRVAEDDVCTRYAWGRLPGRLVVLAMGKLGGGEITYHSDLDLIFVYDEAGAESEGLAAQERFSKFVQRLISVLQATTKEGIVYRIDTRLRPSGRSGPLVSSLAGFQQYHERSAQLWERQALIKARPVAGDAGLGERVAAIVASFVYRAPLTPEDGREMRRMRRRMEQELAQESADRINVKTGRGGMVDVEFVTQMLQLHVGASDPSVRVHNTLAALQALTNSGFLPVADCQLLSDGYRFLRRVDNALRLACDRPVEELERDGPNLSAVARRMGYEGSASEVAAALWRDYGVRREAVRACYERWFDRAAAGFH